MDTIEATYRIWYLVYDAVGFVLSMDRCSNDEECLIYIGP